MATNYNIDYNDERFSQVEADKKVALSDLEQTYAGMINSSDQYYQAQIDASKEWADKQTQLQQEQTDFAIEQIEQQKGQAQKDYIKEQSASYVDWQKQSNPYGANAEQMAAQGLAGSGYHESSQVSMYNTYQNRVTAARESYNQAVVNYNMAIKDARLQNNAALAEIAYQALQTQLELSLEGFQYKNNLIISLSDKKMEVDQMYYNRYQDVLNQINTENALAEEVRQYNQSYNLQVKEYEEGIRQFNEEIARLKAKDAQENKIQIQQLELQKAELAEKKRQFDASIAQSRKTSSSGSKASVTKSKGYVSTTNNKGVSKSKTNTVKDEEGTTTKYAKAYIEGLIAQGATKDTVANAIAIGLREGGLTKTEAQHLRNIYTPRGVQY